MQKKRVLYFAYGSNMSVDRITQRVGRVRIVGKYTITDYKLKFNCGNWYNNVYANMIPSTGSQIEGILYELTERQINCLDSYEVYPNNYDKIYFYDAHKDAIIFAYVATERFTLLDGDRNKPDIGYLNILIRGTEDFGLTYTNNLLLNFRAAKYTEAELNPPKKKTSSRSSGKKGKKHSSGKTSFKINNGEIITSF